MRQTHQLTGSDIVCRVKNARLPGQSEPQNIVVQHGKIAATGIVETLDKEHFIDIDASNCLLVPGLIDLYSRCREPGLTRKGNIASESVAALSAGFTHVMCTPDTVPAVDNVATVELINHRSETVQGGASIIPMAAMTVALKGEQLSELATLQAAGCPVASQADVPIESTTVLYSAMEYASSFDMPLLLTARDSKLGIDGCAHAGAMATQLGLPTVPVAAETVALSRIIELCRETHCAVHISRVSSSRAVKQIHEAKQAGLPVTCDVGIHHLFYVDELVAGYDAAFHSEVPFRSREDRQALRDGLSTGIIDAICSDHAPQDIDAALAPFPVTEPGLSAYDWFIPLMLQVPEITELSFAQVVEKLFDMPSRILGFSTPEPFAIGSSASFVVLDGQATITRENVQALSAGLNNPLTSHDATSLGLAPLRGKVCAAIHSDWLTRFG